MSENAELTSCEEVIKSTSIPIHKAAEDIKNLLVLASSLFHTSILHSESACQVLGVNQNEVNWLINQCQKILQNNYIELRTHASGQGNMS